MNIWLFCLLLFILFRPIANCKSVGMCVNEEKKNEEIIHSSCVLSSSIQVDSAFRNEKQKC